MSHRKKDLPTIWDKDKPGRVSQEFIDLVNAELTAASARLRNPANWPAVQRQAQQLQETMPEWIRAMMGDVGEQAVTKRELEDAVGEELPDYVQIGFPAKPAPLQDLQSRHKRTLAQTFAEAGRKLLRTFKVID